MIASRRLGNRVALQSSDCDRVRRADDRAQNEAEPEIETGKNPLRNVGDTPNREEDEAEREHRNAHQVVAEIAPRCDERGREKAVAG